MYKGHPDQRWGSITYAQHGDDLMLLNIIELIGLKPESVSYLDVGAHHPETISNTKLLYDRGARGVNVDANPHLIAEFNKQRPRDINVCAAVDVDQAVKEFHMYSTSSGRNTLSKEEVARVAKEMPPVREVIQVATTTLQDLVDKHLSSCWPTILLLDIEGLDFSVLNNTIFDSVNRPRTVVVETRKGEPTLNMMEMMGYKGFRLFCRMGENLFFVDNASVSTPTLMGAFET